MDPLKAANIATYLRHNTYLDGSSLAQKKVAWRCSPKYRLGADGNLYYVGCGKGRQPRRVVIGETAKVEVLRLAHEGYAGGNHYGIRNTYYKISRSHYWPGMYKEVLDYCNACEKCQQARPLRVLRSPAMLHPISVSATLSHRWGMDTIGPLKQTARGNQYIVVAVEYLSKWAVAKAVPERRADIIGEFFLDIVTSYGIPNMIIHDRGPEFNNSLLRKMCDVLNVRTAMTSRYHPQTNGLAERMNQTIKVHIMKMVKQNQSDWDSALNPVLMGYRSSCQETLRTSPAQVLYNKRLSLGVDRLLNEGEKTIPSLAIREWDDTPIQTIEVRKAECKDRRVREEVLNNIRTAQERQKRIHLTKHRGQPYTVGDMVYMKSNKPNKGAGSYHWIGPYIVSDLGSTGKCRLINIWTWKELAYEVSAAQLRRHISAKCSAVDMRTLVLNVKNHDF